MKSRMEHTSLGRDMRGGGAGGAVGTLIGWALTARKKINMRNILCLYPSGSNPDRTDLVGKYWTLEADVVKFKFIETSKRPNCVQYTTVSLHNTVYILQTCRKKVDVTAVGGWPPITTTLLYIRHLSQPASSPVTLLCGGVHTCRSPRQTWTPLGGPSVLQAQCRWKHYLWRTQQRNLKWTHVGPPPWRNSEESRYLPLSQEVLDSPGSHHLKYKTMSYQLHVRIQQIRNTKDVTGHCDPDGVAAVPLFRLTPVHPGVWWEGVLNGAGGLTRDPPAILAFLRYPKGGVSLQRPVAGACRRHTSQRDVGIPEELRAVGSDAQSGCRGSQTGSCSLF